MADLKISQLTGATTPLAGTEVVPLVQSSTTKKVAVSDLTAGRAVSMASLNVSSSAANSAVAGIYNTDTSDGNGVYVKAGGANAGKYNTYLQNAASQDLLVIYADGTVQTGIGNIKINTAAKGVNFTANTPAAGMTSQLLNWYEEGTFTPVIADAATGGNAGTADFTFAHYTRIGRQVFFNINLVNINTSGLTAGNNLFLRALPFTSASYCNGFSNMAAVTNFTYAGTEVNAEVYSGASYIRFFDVKSATALTQLKVSAITSGSCNIYINGMYEV